MKTREVFVTNIPIRSFAAGYVEIPATTDSDHMNEAITKALRENGYRPHGVYKASIDAEVDETLIDKWEFTTPLEER